jgi:hypothetical protein
LVKQESLNHLEPTLTDQVMRAVAYVSIRQHTSAYVSIRQHTSAYVTCCGLQKCCPTRPPSPPVASVHARRF